MNTLPFNCRYIASAMLVIIAVVDFEAAAAEPQQEMVARGLAFVAETGEQWMSKRQCVTCHQIPSLIWSHRAAALYNAPSGAKLTQWEEWSTDVVSFVKPEQKSDVVFNDALASNIDTASQLLLAIPRAIEGEQPEWRAAFADRLAELQGEDGSWRACGQLPLQRRPEEETHAVTTLWTSLALINENTKFNQGAALKFSAINTPQSTEWFAARLLVQTAIDESDLAAKATAKQLLSNQNSDGGWGWKIGDDSDALGTGYALYALKRTGNSNPDVTKAATDFLARTQQPNGSWNVPGTKRTAKGRVTATATDWGSAWAVIAIATKNQQTF